jgi:hypothetical protein
MRTWSHARNAYLVAKGQSDKALAAAEESRTDVARARGNCTKSQRADRETQLRYRTSSYHDGGRIAARAGTAAEFFPKFIIRRFAPATAEREGVSSEKIPS